MLVPALSIHSPRCTGRTNLCYKQSNEWYVAPVSLYEFFREWSILQLDLGDALRPAWWQVDLGVETKFICNHYSIHIDGSGSIIEDWKLQGSSDGANWVDLSTHVKERQSYETPLWETRFLAHS
jgi:hypothetical protein